jgi:hypothetical protein
MKQTPYLITDTGAINDELAADLQTKQAYLAQLENAVMAGDDGQVYELLDRQRYGIEVRHENDAVSNRTFSVLVDDMRPKLNHHLAANLILYLAKEFPFFFYEEKELGVFTLYFGDWWDRREFGRIDPVTVSLIFDPVEYQKLDTMVNLSREDKTLHYDEIEEIKLANAQMQTVLDAQAERDTERAELKQVLADTEKKGLFGGSKNADARSEANDRLKQLDAIDDKAKENPGLIAQNDQHILDLQKEETILDYELRAIEDVFGDFETFSQAAGRLYADYLTFLTKQGGK